MIKTLLIGIMTLITIIVCANVFKSTSERNVQNQTPENMIQLPVHTKNNERNTADVLSDEDFVLKNDETFIELGGNYENQIINEKIMKLFPLNEKHVYDTYVYENFIITVLPTADNIVSHISLITTELGTSRGISVEDSILDVFEKYGAPDDTNNCRMIYHYDHKMLIFYFDKYGVITNIVLEMV